MSDEDAIGTSLEQVGEKRFLADLLPTLAPHPNFVNGFGDDASIVRWPGGGNLVFKIDRAAAPMASRRGWAGYEMWGRLAVTSNCSDILAGGGTPLAVMIALILPRDWSTRATIDIIRGCADECSINDITFAGGDTKEGKSPELVGAAVGYCDTNGYLTRKGARAGRSHSHRRPRGRFYRQLSPILGRHARRGGRARRYAGSMAGIYDTSAGEMARGSLRE